MRSLLAMLLSSPLHRLVPGSRVVLVAGGTTVVLPHHREGGSLTVLGAPSASWWRGLDADGRTPVEVVLDGRRHRGSAVFARGEDLDAALLPYLHTHPGAWSDLGVPASADADDVATAARRAAVVLVELRPGGGRGGRSPG